MHCCQFCGRAFSRKFNRDRHEAGHCSKRFDDEEGMTSFSNDEESIEQRTENITRTMMKKLIQLKMVRKPTITMMMRRKAMVSKKLTMVRQAVTQKMMKLILGIS